MNVSSFPFPDNIPFPSLTYSRKLKWNPLPISTMFLHSICKSFRIVPWVNSISGILKPTSRWSLQGRQADPGSQPFPDGSDQKDENGTVLILWFQVWAKEYMSTSSSPTICNSLRGKPPDASLYSKSPEGYYKSPEIEDLLFSHLFSFLFSILNLERYAISHLGQGAYLWAHFGD